MLKTVLFSSLVFFSTAAHGEIIQESIASAYRQKPSSVSTGNVFPRMAQIGVRHIEGKGIGYDQGYSTFELFIRPWAGSYSIFPFIDLRGHIFNNGKFASNVGLGFRTRTPSRIWGFNTYYDYRRPHKRRYNQIGFGFETLGKRWDFRLNSYLPIEEQEGHSLRGADGEIGAHFRSKSPDVYIAAGPYYFEGKDKHAFGAKARFGSKFKDYFSLALIGSYDNLFHGIIQGEIGFYLPLGPKSKAKPKGLVSRANFRTVMDRMIRQPIVRDEIIVLH